MNETRSSIQNLEGQIGQNSKTPQGGLFCEIVKNPKEHVKAVTLRSGKVLGDNDDDNTAKEKEEKIVEKSPKIFSNNATDDDLPRYQIPSRRKKKLEIC
ncbi:hypothetical protein ACH5RR_018534 [Cinchona calisaya]|uniref:Uncharacterized protein n=1 Tax=Cinchona calisaya TaxID=153742 RepID=A0ABD2ZLR5_9GENT